MIGPRLSSVFKSRWMALLWAAGILWTAVDFVGFGDDSRSAAEQGNAQEMAAVDHALGGALSGR